MKIYVIGFGGYGENPVIFDLYGCENINIIEDALVQGEYSDVFVQGGYSGLIQRIYRAYGERKERIIYKQLWQILRRIPLVQDIFYSCFKFSKVEFKKEEKNIILLCCTGFCMGYTRQYLEWVKKRIPNAYYVLYHYDPTDMFFRNLYKDKTVLELFDKVYNINKQDCRKYGHTYWPLLYSKMEINEINPNSNYNLYFCGFGADRITLLEEIGKICRQKEIKYRFINFYFDKKQYEGIECIEKPITYKENLQNVMMSDCILELMHNNYDNQTLRYCEVVVYNKKLLTNNEKIREYPYYNEKYMRVFRDISEIDWQWLSEKTVVNYGYKDDFSPIKLIENIVEGVR